MAKFELSIHEDYLAGRWGVWEGVREVVQNALDAQDDYPSCPMEITHSGGHLQIRSDGAVLGQEVLLLGKTSKEGREDQRGQFGEGLKLGLLALVREGYDTYIMNGDNKWTPYIDRSENFGGERVLWINVRKMQKRSEDFTVYIKMNRAQWGFLKDRFLDLDAGNCGEKVNFSQGEILLDDEQKGKVYVKGIYVRSYDDMDYGYNFTYGVDLDRDRGMVDDWDLKYTCAAAWKEALMADQDRWMDKAFQALKEADSKDLESLGSRLKYDADAAPIRQGFADLFLEENGSDAVPVSCEDEARKVEFYGKKGVVVASPLQAVLEQSFGSMETILRDASENAGEVIPVDALTPREARNFDGALRLLYLSDCGDLDKLQKQVEIYDFQDPKRLGIYDPNKVDEDTGLCRIRVARKTLGSIPEALKTLIHEKAHETGDDGSIDHRAKMERIWGDVTENLLDMAGSGWLFK